MPRPGCAPGARPARRPPRRPCASRRAPGRSVTRRPCRRRRCSSPASRCGPRRPCARARSWPSGTADRRMPRGSACRLRRGAPTALAGSIARKSCLSVRRASSAICPATSQPVGPPPTTAKVSHAPALGFRGRRLGQLERREDPPSQVEGVVDRLHREGVLGELVVSEVRGRRSGGDDQAVVGQRERRSQRPDGDDRPALEIEAGDLGQLDADVLVLAQDSPERRCDLALREDSRRDLVEQRLEEVVVRAVDERDLDVAFPKELRWQGGHRSRRRRRPRDGAVST